MYIQKPNTAMYNYPELNHHMIINKTTLHEKPKDLNNQIIIKENNICRDKPFKSHIIDGIRQHRRHKT